MNENTYTPGYFIGVELPEYKYEDKKKNIKNSVAYMINRTLQMFEYENLPDTIPKRSLEILIQCKGHACIAEHEGNLYAFRGSLGGEPDVNYMPTKSIVANQALRLNKMYTIDEDCVIIPNDSMYMGLLPLHTKYATQLIENEVSMFMASVNLRVLSILSASDDKTMESAKKYLKDLYDGKLGVIAESAFLDGIKSQAASTNQTNTLTNLIEYNQYTKASWYNELGLNSNYNMKRESINSNEAQLNDDMLKPLMDDMLEQREIAIDKINEMFGTDIKVKLNSSWKYNEVETKLELDEIDTDEDQQDLLEEEIDETLDEPEDTEDRDNTEDVEETEDTEETDDKDDSNESDDEPDPDGTDDSEDDSEYDEKEDDEDE